MSVPVPQRGHGELEVNTKARVLTVYTLKILENEKWFPKDVSVTVKRDARNLLERTGAYSVAKRALQRVRGR